MYGLAGPPWAQGRESSNEGQKMDQPGSVSSLAALAPRAGPSVSPIKGSTTPLPSLPPAPPSTSAVSFPILTETTNNRGNDLEAQLAHERRARTKLELEVQAGKNALATMAAKIEQLTSSISACQISFRDTSLVANEADRRIREVEQSMEAKLNWNASNIRQMIADVAGRHQRQDGQTREDETERYHHVMEQVANLKYQLESLQMHTTENGENLRIKAQDLHHESRIGVDAMRIAKAHDTAIGGLHATVETHIAALERRLDAAFRDVTSKVDAEARSREQAIEAHWSKICAITSRHERQEHETADRIESLRSALTEVGDIDRDESRKAIQGQTEHLKSLERGLAGTIDKLGDRILSLESKGTAEAAARVAAHDQIRSDSSQAIAEVEGNLRILIGNLRQQSTETRQSQSAAISTITESVRKMEIKLQNRTEALEQVMRAEISQRVEAGVALEGLFADQQSCLNLLEKKVSEQLRKDRLEIEEKIISVKAESVKSCDSACASKNRALEDQEAQLAALMTRLHNLETTFNAEAQFAQESVMRNKEFVLSSINDLSGSIDSGLRQLRLEMSQNKEASEAASEAFSKDIREKIHSKTLMLDQTLRAFKVDLDNRITKNELDVLSKQLQTESQAMRAQIAEIEGKNSHITMDLPQESQPTPHAEFVKVTKGMAAQIEAITQAHAKVRIEQMERNNLLDQTVADMHETFVDLHKRQVDILTHTSTLQGSIRDAATRVHLTDMQTTINGSINSVAAQLRETFSERVTATQKLIEDLQTQHDHSCRVEARNRIEVQTTLSKAQRDQEARYREAVASVSAIRDSLSHDMATQIRDLRSNFDVLVGHLTTKVNDSSGLCRERTQELRDGMNRLRQDIMLIGSEQMYLNTISNALPADIGPKDSNAKNKEPVREDTMEAKEKSKAHENFNTFSTAADDNVNGMQQTKGGSEKASQIAPAFSSMPLQTNIRAPPSEKINPVGHHAAITTIEAPITLSEKGSTTSVRGQPPTVVTTTVVSGNSQHSSSTALASDEEGKAAASATSALAPGTFFKPPHLATPSTISPKESEPQTQTRDSTQDSKMQTGAASQATNAPKPSPLVNGSGGTDSKEPGKSSTHKEDLERLADAAMQSLSFQVRPPNSNNNT
ncbi:hypothetical protein DFJ77DRAFT_48492 [Powellomyces hirtus]|nr:hypothetical protein DFJ77DRAFT_48492 [Powellomyces hirtus]